MSSSSKSSPSASFFYGTLMFPSIVARLLGRSIPSTQTSQATLDGYVRLHIAERDYPAVVSLSDARSKFPGLEHRDGGVRGVVVSGLSEQEMRLLDEWEADEYVKSVHKVRCEDASEMECWVYVWSMQSYGDLLLPKIWSMEEFKRDKLSKWSGSGGQELEEYLYGEIDELRQSMSEAPAAPFPNGNAV